MSGATVDPTLFRLRAFEDEWVAPLVAASAETAAPLHRLLLLETSRWIAIGKVVGYFPDCGPWDSGPSDLHDGEPLAALAGWISSREGPPDLDASSFGRALSEASEELTSERLELLRLVLLASDAEWQSRIDEVAEFARVVSKRDSSTPSDTDPDVFAWALSGALRDMDGDLDRVQLTLPAGWRVGSLAPATESSPRAASRVKAAAGVREALAQAALGRPDSSAVAGFPSLAREIETADEPEPLTIAQALMAVGKVDEAEVVLARISDPRHSGQVAMHLGQIAAFRGELAVAEAALMRAAEAGRAEALLVLGQVRIQKGDDDRAADAYRLAEEKGLTSAALPLAAILLDEENREDEAEDALRRACDGGHAEAGLSLATLLEKQGREAEAMQALTRAADHGVADAHLRLGRRYRAAGEHERAVESFLRADVSGAGRAPLLLGLTRAEQGNLEAAEEWYRKAVLAGDDQARLNLGVVLQRRGDNAAAERAYRVALEQGDTGAYVNLGALHEARGDRDEAQRLYRDAVAAGRPEGYRALGRLLARDEEGIKEAEEMLRQSVAFGDHNSMLDLGLLLAEQGRIDEAEATLSRAEDEHVPHANAILGEFFTACGERAKARAAYERGAAADDPTSMHNLGVLLSDGDPQAGIPYFERAAALGSAPAANNVGVAFSRRGDDDQAEYWWRQAIADGDTEAMSNLGGLLRRRGDRMSARTLFEAAVARGMSDAYLGLAHVALEDDDADGARASLEEARRRGVKTASAQLGRLLQDAGDLGAAEAAYRRGREEEDPEASLWLALLLSATERHQEAEGLLVEFVDVLGEQDARRVGPVVRRGPEESMLRFRGHAQTMLGLLLAARGERHGALRAFEEGAAAGLPEAAFNAAQVHAQLGNDEAELEWLRRAIAGGESDALVNLAVRQREAGEVDEAEHSLRQAHAVGNLVATGDLGLLLCQQGRLGEAEQMLRAAIAGSERVSDIVNLAVVLEQRGEIGEAVALLRGIAADEPQAAHNLAVLLESEGRQEEALAAYRLAVAAGHAEAHLNLAAHFLAVEDLAAARVMLSSPLLEDVPLAIANRGTLLLLEGDRAGAEDAYARAAELGVSETLLNLARFERRDGDLAQATTTLRRALSLGVGGSAHALGEVYEEMGDLDRAEEAYAIETDDRSSSTFRLGYLRGRQDRIQGWVASEAPAIDDLLSMIIKSGSASIENIEQITTFAEVALPN